MKFEYDQASGCCYIHFLPVKKRSFSHSRELYPGIVLDFDKSGRPIGLEVYRLYQSKQDQAKEKVG